MSCQVGVVPTWFVTTGWFHGWFVHRNSIATAHALTAFGLPLSASLFVRFACPTSVGRTVSRASHRCRSARRSRGVARSTTPAEGGASTWNGGRCGTPYAQERFRRGSGRGGTRLPRPTSRCRGSARPFGHNSGSISRRRSGGGAVQGACRQLRHQHRQRRLLSNQSGRLRRAAVDSCRGAGEAPEAALRCTRW